MNFACNLCTFCVETKKSSKRVKTPLQIIGAFSYIPAPVSLYSVNTGTGALSKGKSESLQQAD
jgi:hypothetical protein